MNEHGNHPSESSEDRPTDKLEAGDLTQSSKVIGWLDNFWYHYKWHVIVGVFVVSVIIIGVAQMLSRPKYDTQFLVGCDYRMDNEQRAAFESMLNNFCPEDYDGNGEKLVNLVVYQIYSEQEVKEAQSAAAAESEQFSFNAKFNNDELNNLTNFTMTGECSVYLLSPYLYETMKTGKRLRPVSDLYGTDSLPMGMTEDGYGVRISKTDLYTYTPALQVLPDDLILCILEPTVNISEEKYTRAEFFFRSLADWRVEK